MGITGLPKRRATSSSHSCKDATCRRSTIDRRRYYPPTLQKLPIGSAVTFADHARVRDVPVDWRAFSKGTHPALYRRCYDRAVVAWWRVREMPSVEERVAYLEGRNEDPAAAVTDVRTDVRDLRTDVRELRTEMVRRFEHSDTRFNWLIGLQFAVLL